MKDDDKILGGHEYDGIKELDNKLPPWWLYLFYFTIIWGIGYFFYYHVIGIGDSSFEEYMKEINPNWTEVHESAGFHIGYSSPFYTPDNDLTPLRRVQLKEQIAKEKAIIAADEHAEKKTAPEELNFDELIISAMKVATPENRQTLREAFPDLFAQYRNQTSGRETEKVEENSVSAQEEKVEPLTDVKSLAEGKNIFEINCVTCHGKLGEGGIGPNLTDDYFLHGPGMNNTVRTITQGVPAKGMISWRSILKEDQIKKVASYVISLYGTNPPNAKSPQGEKASLASSE